MNFISTFFLLDIMPSNEPTTSTHILNETLSKSSTNISLINNEISQNCKQTFTFYIFDSFF